MQAFGYVGVLCTEYFVERGRLIANEIAPRVHNSGHWTIEGADTSQFENHVRAIAGLPLDGQKELLGRYRMADQETQQWVRETIAAHVREHIPGLPEP